MVRDAERMLRRLIGEDIEFVIQPAAESAWVMADHAQIHQVIVNLAANARDAMPNGGKLGIATANVEVDEELAAAYPGVAPGSHVLTTFTDTGAGMPEEVRQNIFEPFFTTKEQGKGTGLGLATVYGIVRQSGGWIEVDSRVGEGTSFRIYLPRIHALPAAATSRSPRVGQAQRRRDRDGRGGPGGRAPLDEAHSRQPRLPRSGSGKRRARLRTRCHISR